MRRRLRKSNPQVESGTRSLHSAMMPDQISAVLNDIDSMLAEANKTIDQSLHHSAHLVEQAQQQLLARHQHLMAPAQNEKQAEPAAGVNVETTATGAESNKSQPQKAQQSPAEDKGHSGQTAETEKSALITEETSVETAEVTAGKEAAQRAVSELEKVLESSAETEKVLKQEQQHIVEKQQQMQETAAAAQKSIESALTNLNQGFMHQQQAYEQAITAKAKAMEEKNQAAASALSLSLQAQQPDKSESES